MTAPSRPRIAESILDLVGSTPLVRLNRVVPAELVRISHELTPGSRYVEVEGAGHSAYFERPEAWNAAVLGFIDGVEVNARGRGRSPSQVT